ncbi:site-specific integrase [Comamonadaceae bacterium PP-2]
MGTVTTRKRADGSSSYRAQIRLKHQGAIVHSEAQTFSRKALAQAWITRREAELQTLRATGGTIRREAITIGAILDAYVQQAEGITPWGRSKTADIKRLRVSGLANKDASRLTSADLIEYAKARRLIDKAGPATVLNDIIWLRQAFLSAVTTFDLHTPLNAIDSAKQELMRIKVIAKPRKRERRLDADEELRLMTHFLSRDARARIPMADIMQFALLTARRQEEICRLRWADVDFTKGVGYIDDVKHPTQKTGNRRAFRILEDAMAIIHRQPRTHEEVFPYECKSVGAAFTRAVHLLELENLRFHDLRHEAASRLFERGYSIQEVAQFTLHESWNTLKRYTHLRPEAIPER